MTERVPEEPAAGLVTRRNARGALTAAFRMEGLRMTGALVR